VYEVNNVRFDDKNKCTDEDDYGRLNERR